MIRLGLIGCGEHAETGHAIPLARYRAAHPGEIELAAACDVQKERAQNFCQKYGFATAYGNVDDMLRQSKLDGCIAVVPPEIILEVGTLLLRRGIPCVVEKPLGASLTDAAVLFDIAKETQTPNMVSVNRRFMPFLNCALSWATTIGPLRYVRGTMTRHARKEPEFIWTTAVHAVDTLRYIAGKVSQASLRTMNSGDTPSWHAIDFRFESGIYGHIDVLPTSGVLEETYEFYGEGFHATVTAPFGRERVVRCFCDNHLVLEKVAGPDMPEDVLNGCYDEAAAFIHALNQKEMPRPSIEDVFPSVSLCLMISNSTQENQVIVHGN
jgi:myo-inositol 2-dehydrogenase / D-chiro-inositol 1-dehydrogenase